MRFTATVHAAIRAIDPQLPTYWVRSLDEQFALNAVFYEVFGTLFTAFGVAALFLATIGLYGVMSFSAANRTREIGVRMALGAARRDILTLVLGRGAWQLAAGLTLGVGLAAVLSLGLRAVLFNVEPWDVGIFLTVLAALSLTGLTACLLPARRAAGIHPIEALRYE